MASCTTFYGLLLSVLWGVSGLVFTHVNEGHAADSPSESAGQSLPELNPVLAVEASSRSAPSFFERTPQQMDELLSSGSALAPDAFDYPAYQTTRQLLLAAGRLVEERGREAALDFHLGGKWYDLKRGRYIALYEQNGNCVFNAVFPFRAEPAFRFATPQNNFELSDIGSVFWRFGFWRNPATNLYEPQVAACLPVNTPQSGPLLVVLNLSAPHMPYDRYFASALCAEAVASVARSGDQALVTIGEGGVRFAPLPGVSVVVADESGAILVHSSNPALASHSLQVQADASGSSPLKKILQTLRDGSEAGVWYSGSLPVSGRDAPTPCLLYVRRAQHEDKRYLVATLLFPSELTQKYLTQGIKQYDQLIQALAAAYADPYSVAEGLHDAGFSFQRALVIPAEEKLRSAEGLWERAAQLYGARFADYCYAASFDEVPLTLSTGEEADALWREQLHIGDSIEKLGNISLRWLPGNGAALSPNFGVEVRSVWERILNGTLYGEANLGLGLNVLYGCFVESLFVSSRLVLAGNSEQAALAMRECQKQGRALGGLIALGCELNHPAAWRLQSALDGMREIFLKELLNPADLARLREESARLRGEILRGVPSGQ